eukprot:CAMPEP_0119082998 /NCGR_PEP_ID=MMETSP1178-20130426/123895_1 /TAXON_ID=33656 /ORGANISM="unid sp, Strain CCMP2000" /LENGTH=143 /DNA_ID=CAMNT_0007065819 /DNA_START=109 /DNA_END=537 /DNA_ORIENTATION=+
MWRLLLPWLTDDPVAGVLAVLCSLFASVIVCVEMLRVRAQWRARRSKTGPSSMSRRQHAHLSPGAHRASRQAPCEECSHAQEEAPQVELASRMAEDNFDAFAARPRATIAPRDDDGDTGERRGARSWGVSRRPEHAARLEDVS